MHLQAKVRASANDVEKVTILLVFESIQYQQTTEFRRMQL